MQTVKEPIITSDGSHTVKSEIYGETYHSTNGSITESQHVFIESGIEYFFQNNPTNRIRIFEMGMGTGLNVLLSQMKSSSNLDIEYNTVELHPLSFKEISNLNYPTLLDNIESVDVFNSIHQCEWDSPNLISNNFTLTKFKHNILELELKGKYDIIFYDAFGPKTQPQLWDINIMKKIYNVLIPNGVFVTYCAMGQLKRDLKSIGYEVQSIPGPPGKREMIRAIKLG